jgi:hypothetical protein
MTTVAQLGAHLRTLFTTVADRLARQTGFVQRRSKLTGSAFAQAVVFGWLVLVAGQLVTGGALTGGLIGALVKLGHTSVQAEALVEHLKSGRYLIIVHTEDTQRAETVLRNAGATDVHLGQTS